VWQEALTANGWTDFLLTGDEFGAFLEEEQTRAEEVLQDIGLSS
jgi:putative tricarboxylic transport membrane protein